jgi:hypothetical protein
MTLHLYNVIKPEVTGKNHFLSPILGLRLPTPKLWPEYISSVGKFPFSTLQTQSYSIFKDKIKYHVLHESVPNFSSRRNISSFSITNTNVFFS